MLDESKAQMDSATGKVRDAALKNTAFFAVALKLLGELPPFHPAQTAWSRTSLP